MNRGVNRETSIAERLREQGYRATPARLAVAQVLSQAGGKLTAREVIDALHEQHPEIGRASVFRSLTLLTRLGVVQTRAIGAGTTSYGWVDPGCHHELICVSCGMAIPFDECVAGDLEQRLARRFDFEATGHRLEIYGRCRDCR